MNGAYMQAKTADELLYPFRVHLLGRVRFAAVIAAVAFTLTSCTTNDATADPPSSSPSPSQPSAIDAVTPESSGPQAQPVVDFDATQTTEQLQSFWQARAKEAGVDAYEPVADDRLMEFGEDPIICNGEQLDDAEIEGNALAMECDEGYTIAWDPALFDEMTAKFGLAAPAMILAHEWGHIVGFQAQSPLDGVLAEQYADCMAGVWVAHAIERRFAPFDALGALDATVAAAADFSDAPGDDPTSSDAHGSAFDRIRAFQEGFEATPAFCDSYETTPPPLTQVPFEPGEDRRAEGNLPLDAILPLAMQVLREFGTDHPDLVSVDGVQPIAGRRSELSALHQRLGDAAPLVVLALDAAAAAQEDTGRDPDEEGELLQQACVVGGFLRWLADGGSEQLELSAGDVDETVATFADLTDPAAAGFLFEQIGQLRTGFTQGASACELPGRSDPPEEVVRPVQ